jgi:hypothetical protein
MSDALALRKTVKAKASPKGRSLKQNHNFFDPDPEKSSPPNEFMMKLTLRMSVYHDEAAFWSAATKADKRDNA